MELLQEDMPDAQRQRFLRNLQTESARLQDFIDRMLLLSALENRQELREMLVVPLDEVIHEALEHLDPLIAEKQLEITGAFEGAGVVRGERFLLVQAVVNLLQNALEFSPPRGGIGITVCREDSYLCLEITDSGPGMPQYARERVFERFYSLPRPANGAKSSGLGLSIVREIALLHAGSVTLENRTPGPGAIARLCLPLA